MSANDRFWQEIQVVFELNNQLFFRKSQKIKS